MSIVHVLPEPTLDLDRARHDLHSHGYCLVDQALDGETTETLRSLVAETAASERSAGTSYHDAGGSNQRVWQLLNKGAAFCNLAAHPLALEFLEPFVGRTAYDERNDDLPNFLLSSITANIAGPGGDAQGLHADQGYVPTPWPDQPLVANIAWMLDDFTADNGATHVVPGSHRHSCHPSTDLIDRIVPAEGPAGCALILDGRLWHGTGENTTHDRFRHGVLAYYCQPWMRQQENSTVSVHAEVCAAATPVLRRLLGFDLFHTLGMIEGLPPRPNKRVSDQ